MFFFGGGGGERGAQVKESKRKKDRQMLFSSLPRAHLRASFACRRSKTSLRDGILLLRHCVETSCLLRLTFSRGERGRRKVEF